MKLDRSRAHVLAVGQGLPEWRYRQQNGTWKLVRQNVNMPVVVDGYGNAQPMSIWRDR